MRDDPAAAPHELCDQEASAAQLRPWLNMTAADQAVWVASATFEQWRRWAFDRVTHGSLEPDERFNMLAVLARPTDAAPDAINEAAAEALVAFMGKTLDRYQLSLVLSVFEDYVRLGHAPPMPVLRAIAAAFRSFRAGATMDAAFVAARSGPGTREGESFKQRELERSNARLFAFFHEASPGLGLSVEDAQARIDALQTAPSSGRTAYEHYKKCKRTVKRDHSE